MGRHETPRDAGVLSALSNGALAAGAVCALGAAVFYFKGEDSSRGWVTTPPPTDVELHPVYK